MDINRIPGIFPDDTARVRSTDPISSHNAADSNTNRADVEAFVAHLFDEFGPLADHELTSHYFNAPGHPEAHPDSPRKRRSDLTRKRVVVPVVDGFVKSPTGRRAQLWTLADAA